MEQQNTHTHTATATASATMEQQAPQEPLARLAQLLARLAELIVQESEERDALLNNAGDVLDDFGLVEQYDAVGRRAVDRQLALQNELRAFMRDNVPERQALLGGLLLRVQQQAQAENNLWVDQVNWYRIQLSALTMEARCASTFIGKRGVCAIEFGPVGDDEQPYAALVEDPFDQLFGAQPLAWDVVPAQD